MLVVAAVSLMLCLRLFSSVVFSFCQQVSKQIVCFFCLFFFLPLSLYPPIAAFTNALLKSKVVSVNIALCTVN